MNMTNKMQKLDFEEYLKPKYNGAYFCDICGDINGHSGKSGAIHCE